MTSLYKYVRGDVKLVQAFLEHTVRFTPVAELNDPSELRPVTSQREIRDSLERMRGAGYTQAEYRGLQRQDALLRRVNIPVAVNSFPETPEDATELLRSSAYDDIERLETLLARVAERISSNVGLLCLSQRWDSLPMWAHYADNAKGFLVEFEDLGLEFPGDDTGLLGRLSEVEYSRGLHTVTFDPDSHKTMFLEKFADWDYEREMRVILPLNECDVRELGSEERKWKLYLHTLQTARIARLVLGWNMPPELKDSIREVVDSSERSVEVVDASITSSGQVEIGSATQGAAS